jgi:hypothetical protein
MEGRKVLLCRRVWMHKLDPTRTIEKLLHRGQLPSMRRYASKLHFDEGLEHNSLGMGEPGPPSA